MVTATSFGSLSNKFILVFSAGSSCPAKVAQSYLFSFTGAFRRTFEETIFLGFLASFSRYLINFYSPVASFFDELFAFRPGYKNLYCLHHITTHTDNLVNIDFFVKVVSCLPKSSILTRAFEAKTSLWDDVLEKI